MKGGRGVPGLDLSVRVYRFLLRLYPRDFRQSHGADATDLFRDRYRMELLDGGWRAVGILWARTLANVLRNGPAERWSGMVRSGPLEPSGWTRDVVHAVRSLRSTAGSSAAALLTLGLGIGATVSLFSLVHGILLQPLPYPDADRIVQLWERNDALERTKEGPSPLNFVDWQARSASFSDMAAWYLTSGTYRNETTAEEVRAAQVTTDFFRVLGIPPALGRDFAEDEGVRYGPVMLSDPFWRRHFGGDPDVVGRTLEISGVTYPIAGVMPAGFDFPDPSVEMWMAWDFPRVYGPQPESRTWRFLQTAARLAPGLDPARAERELAQIHGALAREHPDANGGWTATVTPLHDEIVAGARGTLMLAFGSVALLLLLACANVANLLLARVPARAGEMAIRRALGAGRGRLVRQLAIENLTLAGLGSMLGLGVAAGVLALVRRFEGERIPRLDEVALDPPVLLFSIGLAVLTSALFGLAPLLRLVRDPSGSLRASSARSGSAPRDGLRSGLVIAQVALSLLLLVGASLFIQSFNGIRSADMGFDPDGVLSFRLSLDSREAPEAGDIARYYDGLLERLLALPGVTAAGAAQTLPVNPVGNDFSRPYRPAGTTLLPAEAATVAMRIVTPGYFSAAGMRFVSGEPIPGAAAPDDPRVAVVNETLARRLWPSRDPVGEVFEVDFRDGWQPYRVTGVLSDVRHQGARADVPEEVYLSHRQSPYLAMSVILRTSGEPNALIPAVRREVLAHAPSQPPHYFVSFHDLVSASTSAERFLAVFMAMFAAASLVLATGGVYGVVARGVAARRREMGIRLALGAEAGILVRAVAWESARIAGMGVVAGLLAALILGRTVQGLLYGVSPSQPVVLIGLAGGLLAVATGAALLSARPIARLDPSETLRGDHA